MTRQIFAVLLVAVSLSTAVGFALGSATRPEPADAASGNAEVVRQLKKVNANLRGVNARLGQGQASKGSVRGLLTIICDYTASIDCGP
jgi:hypothetical protein